MKTLNGLRLAMFVGLVAMLFLSISLSVQATPVDTYQFKSEVNQVRALSIANELRCPQCQNQNLIDSNSPVAQDLRLVVFKMVDAGKSDRDIIDFMTSRYGEFVLYKPKMEPKTYLLWLGPSLLLLMALLIGFIFIRRHSTRVNSVQAMSEDEHRELEALLKKNKQ
ncbi:heme lyase NrfEFG subunit NrfF [uncultured Shewanella sp.]|uniref:heme lyase NrfEFG subunit NrfF n=1 Tax=uncultured Shewanella sp. TaxID=173975 RepID=UPI00261E3711|nr:heme lyase NrfEFG subunit NrfF [uncultured Shewanella sp.]